MKHYSIALAAVLAGTLTGCQSTAEGLKEDSRNNSISASNSIKEGIDNGANIAKNAGEDLAAATKLTPRIKNAINADPNLNADGNLVDVDTTPTEVTLNGHVNSRELKDKAFGIASAEMVKAKAEQKLVNKLKIVVPPKK